MAWNGWNRRTLTLLLIASLAFNVGVGVTFGVQAYQKYATLERPPECGPGPGGDSKGRGWRHLRELNLTPDQDAALDAARGRMIERSRERRSEIRSRHEALTELMSASNPDRVAVEAELAEIARLRAEMDRELVEHFLEVKQLLDPAQQEAFNRMIHKAFLRGAPGHGPFGGRGRRHPDREIGERGALHEHDDCLFKGENGRQDDDTID